MTLVFLHALPFDATMWTDAFRRLDDDTIAPRLYDLGDSLEAWAHGVLETAGSGTLTLIGNSIGGSCALEIARIAPERIAAIVLIGAKASHRPDPMARDTAIRMLNEDGIAAAWQRYWAPLFGPTTDPGVVESARAIAVAQPVEDIVRGLGVFHSRQDRSAFAQSWNGPITLISGEHDRTPAATTALASLPTHVAFHRVGNSGHYVSLEQPQTVDAILRATVLIR